MQRLPVVATGVVTVLLSACTTETGGDGGRGSGGLTGGLTAGGSGPGDPGGDTNGGSDSGESGDESSGSGESGNPTGGTSGGGDDSGDSSGGTTGGSPGTSGGSGGNASDGGTSDGSASGGNATDGGGTTGGDAATSGGASGGLRFDVGNGNDVPIDPTSGSEEGCTKVDFLFVVDNSGSMGGEQTNLRTSFPGFIAAIEDEVQVEDFHIMVVDTDAGGLNTNICDTICQVLDECQGVPCDMLPPPGGGGGCDDVLGAGRLTNGAGMACGVTGGNRYAVEGQADLTGTFSCLGDQGTSGDGNERQMEAMTEAIGPLNGVGQCNEGFVRDDAILVVTVITDEEDDTSTPAAWKQALVDAKNGDESAVVVLGLFGDTDVPGGVCSAMNGMNDGADPSPNLRAFADSFMFGQWGSVCASDYAPFFSDAVGVIDGACDVFMPPG